MEKLFQNRKIVFGIIAVVAIIAIAGMIFFVAKKEHGEEKKIKEATYTMYVKINPLVKLTFQETYYECKDDEGNWHICSERSNQVLDYDMLNDDAKDVYHEIDFKGKTVADSLVVLCDVARDNNIGFEALEITSDYVFDWKEVQEQVKNGSKYDITYHVFVDFKEHLNEQEIIEHADEGPLVTYTVTFDSNGGSAVEEIVVRENDVVLAPEAPTRKGYTFVSWQYNGKDYDFTSLITEDTTLKAKWKKNEDKDTKPDNTSSTEEKPKEEQGTRKVIYRNFKFQNLKKGLYAYSADDEYIFLEIVGPKSFVKNTSYNDLIKYISVTIDVNGKDVGNYELPFKISTSREDLKVTSTDPSVNVKVVKEATSTLDKINLNENILIYESGRGVPCGATYVFSDNIATVMSAYNIGGSTYSVKYPSVTEGDFETYEAYREAYDKEAAQLGKEWSDVFSKVTYNSTKASNANKEINQILSTVKGLKDVYVGDHPEDFGLSYDYIRIYNYNALGTFGKAFNQYYSDVDDKVTAVLDKYGMSIIEDGGCGAGPGDPILLTGEICTKYGLNCDRW